MNDPCQTYICPICFEEVTTAAFMPTHCGHLMPYTKQFLGDPEKWLNAREYILATKEQAHAES